MLTFPPGRDRAAAGTQRLTGRERRMIAGVLGMVAALAVVAVIALATASRSSRHGCIYTTIPGEVGAQEISQCGAAARATCASAHAPGAFSGLAAGVVAAACRRAGLPVGGRSRAGGG